MEKEKNIKFNNIIYELNDGHWLIKEYDYDHDLIFEGEYVNGERNGKGKEYSEWWIQVWRWIFKW